MRNEHMTTAIAQRALRCPRPHFLLNGPDWGTRADYEFWERLAARFVSKNPDNVDGWVVLGHSRFQLDDFEGARKAYRVAVGLKDNADMWFSLGLSASGEERIGAFRTALQHMPDDGKTWHSLADALADGEHYEEAIQSYETALEHSDASSAAWVLCDLGLCYLATHLVQDSISAFERSVLADGGIAFGMMLGHIADACLKESLDFAHAVHARLVPISQHYADLFLSCYKTRSLARK